MNPKFQFTQEQSLSVLKCAYHLNAASKEILETNGMLGLMLNSMAIELIDQCGYLDTALENQNPQVQINLNEKEKAQVDDLIKSIKENL